jgi:hypothetical protein
MHHLKPLTDDRISEFKLQFFAKSFLHSPLARAMYERGEPLRFFLPVLGEDSFEWKGVDITIAGVPRSVSTIGTESQTLSLPGDGHREIPRGPLQPRDFPIHSHPDTGKPLQADGPSAVADPATDRHERVPRS